VHDQVPVSVLDRVTHLEEEIEAGLDGEVTIVAVPVDRRTVHVLHHVERGAVVGHAPVEQPGDSRVLEPRQDLPFPKEPLEPFAGAEPHREELERHFLLELPVGACGEKHHAHPTGAERPDDAVAADGATDEAVRVDCRCGRDPRAAGERGEVVAGRVGGFEEGEHLAAQLVVVATRFRHGPRAGGGGLLQCGPENLLDPLPALRVHAQGVWRVSRISRWSQAPASCQSRLTVAGEIARACAVSSMDRPT